MRSRSIAVALALLLSAAGCKGQDAAESKAPPTEDEKTLYALGLMMGQSVAPWGLSPGEIASVQKGLADAASGVQHGVDLKAYQQRVQALAQARAARAAVGQKEQSKAFVEQAAAAPGAERLPSGLVYRALLEGSGPSPKATSTVKVHYEGKLTDGKVFDSSRQRGQPAEFPLGQVIRCWQEGVQRMKVGGRAQLVCPSDIAYGDQGRPPMIPGGATLVFEVELLEVR
jgi:FKBP-type peptidyl-prolyl cis-trans isomerase FkpA